VHSLRRDLQSPDAIPGDGEVVVEVDGAAWEVALKPRDYAVAIIPKRLAAGDRGRVLVLRGSAGPPTANGIESIAGLSFIDDGRIVAEESDDPIYITLGVELEVALDGLGDVLERGLLLRFAMLAAEMSGL
jgi:hypothetical protein